MSGSHDPVGVHMTTEPLENQPEEERAYWENRVAGLELIVCELMFKNERLRQELHTRTFAHRGEPSGAQMSRERSNDHVMSMASATESTLRMGY